MAVTRALLLVVLALLVAGCSGDENAADQTTDTATVTLPASSSGRVYWLRDGKVWPVRREIRATDAATAALDELFAGPSEVEKRSSARRAPCLSAATRLE